MTVQPPQGGRRRGLGRGLDALLGPAADPTAAPVEAVSEDEAILLDVAPALVDPNPEQPRREFEPAALAALAESIRLHGLLHPIVVERSGDRYRLVAGERRLRAAGIAAMASIPAIVRPAAESARESLESALTENLLRADLSAIEEAAAYARLADTFGLSHETIAMRLGRSRPAVSNTIRLLTLSAGVQRALVDGVISAGHARALLSLPFPAQQEAMAARVAAGGWSVRQTETAVRDALSGPRPASASRALAPDDESLRRGIEESLGLPVELERRGKGGRVSVAFHDDADLDALYARLGGRSL